MDNNIDEIFNLEVLNNAEKLKGKTIKDVENTYERLSITTEDGCFYQLGIIYLKGHLTDEIEASFVDVTKELIKESILDNDYLELDEEFKIGLLDYEKYKKFVGSSPIIEWRNQKLEEIKKKKEQIKTIKNEIIKLESEIEKI